MASEGAIVTQQPKYLYDVFLSFRGKDTRYTFTANLCHALRCKGVKTFMDEGGLKFGDEISPTLLNAIEKSRISIVVLSENYASSSWCLDELVKILECKEMKNQLVWPIFYKVDPTDVRYQKNSYGEAMAKHETGSRHDSKEVLKWRSALTKVANLSGRQFQAGYEFEFIKEIVKSAATKSRCRQLYLDEPHLVGHELRLKEVKPLLNLESGDTVCMIGIYGTGGIGKTTLAKALYNLVVDRFDCATFVEKVRESKTNISLKHLQETMLSKLFEEENIKLCSVSEGAAILQDKLCHRRVLLVLDDVDGKDQIEKLAGNCNWFGPGSRIIITTRDRQVLDVHHYQVKETYEMKGLDKDEALQLFCWSAFSMSQPAPDFKDVSDCAVCYANGLPLALKVIGSNLVRKNVEECKDALEEYERILDRNIYDILRISYDCLSENAQSVFLDIACFFNGRGRKYVEEILKRCDFHPTINIQILVDKSLLTIDEYGCLRMHGLIQDMGKEVVRQEAPKKPGKRSRLWFHEDVLRVLEENSGSSKTEGIILDLPKEEEEEEEEEEQEVE